MHVKSGMNEKETQPLKFPGHCYGGPLTQGAASAAP